MVAQLLAEIFDLFLDGSGGSFGHETLGRRVCWKAVGII
jgi:hypothetical protein